VVRDRSESLTESGCGEEYVDRELLHNWRRLTESGRQCK
jgi:hypothetical protein